jgi:putative redox protein
MIQTGSQPPPFQTVFSSSLSEGIADAPVEKGGGGLGFGPHELLEAALATCTNMAVRMRAAKLRGRVDGVSTVVKLDGSQGDVATFEYATTIRRPLTRIPTIVTGIRDGD